jgi:N-acetylmuramoyl-L-alanine amidase
MRAKIMVSLCSVIGLAALGVIALIATVTQASTDPISERAITVVHIADATPPEETQESNSPAGEELETEEFQPDACGIELDSGDSYLLAKIAMAEAEGEDTEGKALVMLVVLNRVKSDRFPNTVEGVIYQKNQFSPVSNGRFDSVEPDEDCWSALEMIQTEHWDGSQGATYFESKSESTWHSEHLSFLFQHGNHYFYEDKEG